MSKSYGNTIGLSESPESASSKVQSMSTNNQRIRQTDPGNYDLCPVGDLHKVFSPLPVLDNTRIGCQTAAISCERCKMMAAQSVTVETYPIYAKRRDLEASIEQTWEMLISQSKKASKRAEETMGAVRAALNISRDLGSVRQHFGLTAEAREKRRDLSGQAAWLELPADLRGKMLRDYWRKNIVPSDLRLTQEANRVFKSLERELQEPFLTARKKRVFVGAPLFIIPGGKYFFQVPTKTYEVWTLLVWRENKWLDDFVIPQRYFSKLLAAWKEAIQKNPGISEEHRVNYLRFLPNHFETSGSTVPVFVEDFEGRVTLWILNEPIEITELKGNYLPLE